METLPVSMSGGLWAQPAALQPPGGALPCLRGPDALNVPTPEAPPPDMPTQVPTQVPIQVPTQALTPEQLHPALWRANQVGRQTDAAWPSGFAALDRELPGGGWPARVLTELLLPHPGVGEFRLLAPALVAVQRAQRSLLLFDPPAALCGWALVALGLDMQQLVVVRSVQAPEAARRPGVLRRAPGTQRARWTSELPPPAADMLWALEQALKSGHVGAVLAWLPLCLRADALRRLQLAAQGHDGPAFLVREAEARLEPSAAPLRLLLDAAGPDELCVRLLKRRGPPLAEGLKLELPPVLSGPARQRALRQALPVGSNPAVPSPVLA